MDEDLERIEPRPQLAVARELMENLAQELKHQSRHKDDLKILHRWAVKELDKRMEFLVGMTPTTAQYRELVEKEAARLVAKGWKYGDPSEGCR